MATIKLLEPLRSHTQLFGGQMYPQTTPAGPVQRRVRALGARVSFPGEIPVPLRVSAYQRGSARPTAVFDQIRSPQFQDVLSEPGSGSITFANDDPDLAVIDEQTLLLFEVHGWATFTLVPRQLERSTVSPSEDVGGLTTVTGPGSLALLEEAVVYPVRGLRVWPIEEDRMFSWPSVDYNDAWWDSAWALAGVMDPSPAWYGIQPGWPAGVDADWIGPPNTTTHLAPSGRWYVRSTFNVPEGAAVRFWIAADDIATVYIDAQQLLQTEPWGNVPGDVKSEPLTMSAGEHTIAIEIDNGTGSIIFEGSTFNPTGVVVGMATLNPDGSIKEALPGSAAGWRVLAFPNEPPGMTPGEVMRHCIGEAQNRGGLVNMATAFDDATDSAGSPWPIVGDIATKVGYDLLTFFRELAGTYVDLTMAPGSMTLYAWAYGTRGETTGVPMIRPTDPTDPWTGNLGELKHKRVL